MGMLVEGEWRETIQGDASRDGSFRREESRFRDWVTPDGRPRLWAYTRDLYQRPGIAETVALGEYKLHYYGSHRTINPTGIVPLGPDLDFSAPHGRG